MEHSIRIPRPSLAQPIPVFTEGRDLIRGSDGNDFFGFSQDQVDLVPLLSVVSPEFDPEAVLNSVGIDRFTTEADLVSTLLAIERALDEVGVGADLWDTPLDALNFVRINASFAGIDTNFGGDDTILGRGGSDFIADLEGNNRIYTDEGQDTIYTGFGNDRIVDRGGGTDVIDLGGNNSITLLGSVNALTPNVPTDTVFTGDGDDNINAFDGRNFIDAGNGDNIVRGGANYDEFKVGNGDDFVEVRGAFLNEDSNENGVLDFGEDSNFNGVLDPADSEVFILNNLGLTFEAHNAIFDAGGSDTLKSTTGGDQGDDLAFSDFIVAFDKEGVDGATVVEILGIGNIGNDLIDLGSGDNLVVDAGGNDTVQTLDGDDIIFTSFVSAGNDTIDAGGGNDFINPGSGSDMITGGTGKDTIDLENDGSVDTLVYAEEDVTFSSDTTDVVIGFEGSGVDKLDVSNLGVDRGMLLLDDLTDSGGTVGNWLLGWNTGGGAEADFFTTILIDFDLSTLTDDNFILA